MTRQAGVASLGVSKSRWRLLGDYLQLLGFHQPISTYLLIWPCLWAIWIASEGLPSSKLIALFILALTFAKACGCILNAYIDHHQQLSGSSASRQPLTSGRISRQAALTLALFLSLLTTLMVIQTSQTSVLLATGVVLIAFSYPLLKRQSFFAQIILAAVCAFPVAIAYINIQENIPITAWLLYLATLLWILVYQSLLSQVTLEHDLNAGIRSTAMLFGDAIVMLTGLLEGLILIALILLGKQLGFSFWFHLGLGVSILLWIWQARQIQDPCKDSFQRAYMGNHWVGAAIFAGIFLHYSLS